MDVGSCLLGRRERERASCHHDAFFLSLHGMERSFLRIQNKPAPAVTMRCSLTIASLTYLTSSFASLSLGREVATERVTRLRMDRRAAVRGVCKVVRCKMRRTSSRKRMGSVLWLPFLPLSLPFPTTPQQLKAMSSRPQIHVELHAAAQFLPTSADMGRAHALHVLSHVSEKPLRTSFAWRVRHAGCGSPA